MGTVIRKISTLHDRIIRLLAYLSGILLALMTLSVTIDVITRKLLGYSMIGLVELNEHALVFMTFFAAAFILKENGHVKVDLVLGWLNPRAQNRLNLVTSLVGGALCLFISYRATLTVWDLWIREVNTVKSLEIPMAPLYLSICIGTFMISLQFFKGAYQHFTDLRKPGE